MIFYNYIEVFPGTSAGPNTRQSQQVLDGPGELCSVTQDFQHEQSRSSC